MPHLNPTDERQIYVDSIRAAGVIAFLSGAMTVALTAVTLSDTAVPKALSACAAVGFGLFFIVPVVVMGADYVLLKMKS